MNLLFNVCGKVFLVMYTTRQVFSKEHLCLWRETTRNFTAKHLFNLHDVDNNSFVQTLLEIGQGRT